MESIGTGISEGTCDTLVSYPFFVKHTLKLELLVYRLLRDLINMDRFLKRPAPPNVVTDRFASPAPKKQRLSAKQGAGACPLLFAPRSLALVSLLTAVDEHSEDKFFYKFCKVVVVAGSYHQ